MENPVCSMIFRYPPLQAVLSTLEVSEVVTDCCAFQTTKFGERHLKQFKVVFTGGNWGLGIRRKCKCPGGEHVALMRRSEDGKVSGTKKLKESQAYPAKFGEVVVASWLDVENATLEAEADDGKGNRTIKKRPASSTEKTHWMLPAGTSSTTAKRSKQSQSSDNPVAGKASWMRPCNAAE